MFAHACPLFPQRREAAHLPIYSIPTLRKKSKPCILALKMAHDRSVSQINLHDVLIMGMSYSLVQYNKVRTPRAVGDIKQNAFLASKDSVSWAVVQLLLITNLLSCCWNLEARPRIG